MFGYTAPALSREFATVYPVTLFEIHQFTPGPNGHLIQTAPILNPVTEPLAYLSAFTHTKNITASQTAEGLYLYRLAHPTSLLESAYLSDLLAQGRVFVNKKPENVLDTEELPALQFLTVLQNPSFVPNSYAELALLFPQYPKHVVLNEKGIPVKTVEAQTARLLDTYLMLSNRKELGAFNNTAQGANYTPFRK